MSIHESVSAEIEAIARDNVSGASALLQRGLGVLARAAGAGPETVREVALALCRAQPSMAGFRTAAEVVRDAAEPAIAIERMALRTRRAPAAIARHVSDLLALRHATGPLRLVTCSRSATVEAAIARAGARGAIVVSCAEGRPKCEGRQLAAALARSGVRVEFFSDAAIGTALEGADAVLIGADAVSDSAFINKVGTAALAALAALKGVPTYVLAGAEKVVSPAVFNDMPRGGGAAAEVWADAPEAVTVENPYFEVISLELAAAVITEAGVVAPNLISMHSYNMLDRR